MHCHCRRWPIVLLLLLASLLLFIGAASSSSSTTATTPPTSSSVQDEEAAPSAPAPAPAPVPTIISVLPALSQEDESQDEEPEHRSLRHTSLKKKGVGAIQALEVIPGTGTVATAIGATPFGPVGGATTGIFPFGPFPALAPAVQPGISQGIGRRRDAIDRQNAGGHKHKKKALCNVMRFTPPLSFPAGGVGPTDVEIGDVNNDKIKDLVVAASGSDVVVVLIGCGDGTYFPGVRYPVGPPGSFPYRIKLCDLNHDKRLDIVTANLGGGTVSVLLGRGDGTFTNGFVFPTGLVGGGPVDLALGDFNGDGIPDLALALAKCDTLTILWGDGLGAFIRPVKIVLGVHKGFPLSILAVDLDLNGFADLVVGLSCAEKNLAVLMSLGDGTFRPPHFIDLGCKTKPVQIVTCLFNLDLFPDLAIANGALSNSVSVLLGRGDGTFRRPREWSVAPGLAPMALAVGDFDKDHHCDICTANSLSNDVTVLRGHGDGTFSRLRTFPVDGVGIPGPSAIAAGLLNHDIKHDIVVTHFSGNVFSVLLNTCIHKHSKH